MTTPNLKPGKPFVTAEAAVLWMVSGKPWFENPIGTGWRDMPCHGVPIIWPESNTRYAQGGIAGVMFPDDRVEDHIRDTLVAGAGLGDEAAVRVLATEGPERIRELVALGVAFGDPCETTGHPQRALDGQVTDVCLTVP